MADSEAGGMPEYKHIFGARVHLPIDVDDAMLKHAIDTARRHLHPDMDWQEAGDDVVRSIKAEFDEAYGPHWHVVVGKHFGSKVTHDAKTFMFFYVDDKAVLMFKSG